MASNFKETAVKTVQVERKRLQETLSKNLEIHKQEYKEAMEGYESARFDLLTKLNEATAAAVEKNTVESRKAVHEAYNEFNHLERPQDHSKSYEQAISLMKWETRDIIELSINDFECYVEDNWNWKRTFKNAHANYSAHTHA